MAFAAKVICDSISSEGVRLTTLEVCFPRIILAEFNTHRVFSRNSASSRAIPVEKRIAMIEADPFIPSEFGKNKRGMQADEALDGDDARASRDTWMLALEHAILYARVLANRGVHKQLANRLLEPFAWHTVVVTATEWGNFFGLRCSPAAQPEMQTIARMMFDALDRNNRADFGPQQLEPGEWHLPYVTGVDYDKGSFGGHLWARISAARCARTSYLTQDGKRDPGEDLALGERLESAGHMSPFEHPAQVDDSGHGAAWAKPSNFRPPWVQLRKLLPNEADFSLRTSLRGR